MNIYIYRDIYGYKLTKRLHAPCMSHAAYCRHATCNVQRATCCDGRRTILFAPDFRPKVRRPRFHRTPRSVAAAPRPTALSHLSAQWSLWYGNGQVSY